MGKDAKAESAPAKRIKGKTKPSDAAAEPKRPPALRKPSKSLSSKVKKTIKKEKEEKVSKAKVKEQS